MSKKDKQRVEAMWRREFVIGPDRVGSDRRETTVDEDGGGPVPRAVPETAGEMAGERASASDPGNRREAIAGEVRCMALELVEECAQLSSLAVRLAAVDEASDEAHTLARDALGAAAAARGMLFALLRHVEVVPRDEGPWSLLVPPGRNGR